MGNRRKELGGVSLFIVIFTTLLVTIVTVSFTQAMVRNQQQVSDADLSQRAYNSALAGVEDAKRVLIAQQKACKSGPQTECDALNAAITSDCDVTTEAGIAGTTDSGTNNKEVTVGDPADNQAYTCVKISTKTPDYQDNVDKNDTKVVPLRSDEEFDHARITWFTSRDAPKGTTAIDSPPLTVPASLPAASEWTAATPPILRTQFIPGDVQTNDLTGDAKTTFLYPLDYGNTTGSFEKNRRSNESKINLAKCQTVFSAATTASGACSIDLELPKETKSAYLQLSALYNDTHFTVELCKGNCTPATRVDFDGVQPTVDSTGRANNLFRRVQARIKLNGVSFPYPNAALNVKGNLCKDFSLEDKDNDYDPGDCEPALENETN